MKKCHAVLLVSLVLALFCFSQSAFAQTKSFNGSGEVTSVDPLYSRVTIKHSAIKGFSGDTTTEFAVASADLLKNLSDRDLVAFTVTDNHGDVKIEKIIKTGVAAEEEKTNLGTVAQDVLVGTGEVAKGVTQPLQPVHEVVSGAVGATTGATGSVLEGADGEGKTKF